jgi:hypothetical protein
MGKLYPCEPGGDEAVIFVFSSPFVLPLLTSIIVYCWIIRKSGKPLKDYIKALLFSVLGLVICIFSVVCIGGFVETFLKNKYYGTEMYGQYFEIPCGMDYEMMTVLPNSLIWSIGTIIGGFILWGLVSLAQILTTRIKAGNVKR